MISDRAGRESHRYEGASGEGDLPVPVPTDSLYERLTAAALPRTAWSKLDERPGLRERPRPSVCLSSYAAAKRSATLPQSTVFHHASR